MDKTRMIGRKQGAVSAVLVSAWAMLAGCNNENLKNETNTPRPTGENGVAVMADATKESGGTVAPRDVPSGTTLSGTDASQSPTANDANRQTAMGSGGAGMFNKTEATGAGNRIGSAVGSGSDGVGGQIKPSTAKSAGTANIGEGATNQPMDGNRAPSGPAASGSQGAGGSGAGSGS